VALTEEVKALRAQVTALQEQRSVRH
jgi:hypothetical protein